MKGDLVENRENSRRDLKLESRTRGERFEGMQKTKYAPKNERIGVSKREPLKEGVVIQQGMVRKQNVIGRKNKSFKGKIPETILETKLDVARDK